MSASVVLDDGGKWKGSSDRSFGSASPSDCEHASKRSSSGRARKQKHFIQASFDFLVRRFLDFAPPTTVVAPQADAQTWFDASRMA